MTELQKREFEILNCFLNVCEELDLTYYLVCGSALGAVKYNGFIPWDDDIDVALPRDDYEKFLLYAKDYLPEWIFVQNYKTNNRFPLLGTKLRDNHSTYIETWASKIDMHHGVFIDVFPLDGYPKEKKSIKKFEHKKIYYWKRRCVQLERPFHRNIGLTICSLFWCIFRAYDNTATYVEINEEMLKKNSVKESDIWCNFANSMSKKEYSNKLVYGKGTWAIFEGRKVRVPEKYDEYLTQKYGDWMGDLPESKRKGHHYYVVYDLETPYKEYVQIVSNGRIKVKKI